MLFRVTLFLLQYIKAEDFISVFIIILRHATK